MRQLAITTMVLLLGGCALGGGDEEPEAASLKPKFAPSASTLPASNTSAPAARGSATTVGRTATGSSAAAGPTTPATPVPATTARGAPPPAPITPTTGSITDRRGDVTVSLDRRPAWADLLGGTLTRRAEDYELRVKLGGAVPGAYDTERTINVASFYDVTGDGTIDYEIWVNLAASGWGGSYFDNTRQAANRINDEALAIATAGDELVVTFPLAHLARAERMQWALAMEWGRYEAIGTSAAARDDAPDNDAAAPFPSA